MSETMKEKSNNCCEANNSTNHGKQGWSIERQVRFTSGMAILLGIFLSMAVNYSFIFLSCLFALGMVVSALAGSCALGYLLEKLPWNRKAI